MSMETEIVMPEVEGTADWGQYAKLVIEDIRRLTREQESFRKELAGTRTDIARLVAEMSSRMEGRELDSALLRQTREEFSAFRAETKAKMAVIAIISSIITSAVVSAALQLMVRK